MKKRKIKILGISGSLRGNSSATVVLRHVAAIFPADVDFIFYNQLGSLPHFDGNEVEPAAVSDFKALITAADGIMMVTPEYAFGIPGSLKNALDWTVSSGEFTGKPVAVITASSVGKNAHAALLLVLSALAATVPENATLVIPFIRAQLNEKAQFKDEAVLQATQNVVTALLTEVRSRRQPGSGN